MATILIIEAQDDVRQELRGLGTPHDLVCVASAEKAWTLVEAGFTFDHVIYFADPIGEALLQAAAVEHESDWDRAAKDLALLAA